jgi:hypothetical protein
MNNTLFLVNNSLISALVSPLPSRRNGGILRFQLYLELFRSVNKKNTLIFEPVSSAPVVHLAEIGGGHAEIGSALAGPLSAKWRRSWSL